MNALEAQGLTKTYGARRAVDGISFAVSPGEVVGFLGPNGAGKTTTMRMLAGLVRPTAGRASVMGSPVPGPGLRALGAIIEEPSFYPYLSGLDNLRYAAGLHGGLEHPERRIREALAAVGLESRGRDRVHKYSQGMRQRLGLARAVLADPKVLLLDEPTNGLDPEGVAGVRDTIRGFGERGIAVLVSSHILAEVERVAGRVLIVDKGKLLADGPVERLFGTRGQADAAYRVETTEPARAVEVLRREPWVALAQPVENGVRALIPLSAAYRLGPLLVQAGVPFTELARDNASLEDAYLRVVGAQAPAAEAGIPRA